MINIINVAHAGVITDAPTFKEIGLDIFNFLLSIVGAIAIIALIVSGLLYFFSVGDEKRIQVAKRSITYAIVGVVIALGGMVAIRMIGQFFN